MTGSPFFYNFEPSCIPQIKFSCCDFMLFIGYFINHAGFKLHFPYLPVIWSYSGKIWHRTEKRYCNIPTPNSFLCIFLITTLFSLPHRRVQAPPHWGSVFVWPMQVCLKANISYFPSKFFSSLRSAVCFSAISTWFFGSSFCLFFLYQSFWSLF